MQQNLDNAERDAIIEKLKVVHENNKCFDCEKKNPKWASVYLGIFLCLDCAGKHREYGVQISFVRSLTLDAWSKRQITFLEIGGNAKAAEYFRKQGLKAPFEYKSQVPQKYKTDLIKKVDIMLSSMQPITQTVEKEDTSNSETQIKKEEENKSTQETEKPLSEMFANNVVIANPNQTKTKVEFSSNKPTFTSKKGLAAKKIDNFDLDSLTLEEDSKIKSTSTYGMTDSNFGLSGNSTNNGGVKEVSSKTNYTSYSNDNTANDEKLKKFSGSKAISSESFKDKSDMPAADVQRFSGASSISSSQYFGTKEEDNNSGRNYYDTVEGVKDFMTQISGKVKEKAGGLIDKVKTQWNERGSG